MVTMMEFGESRLDSWNDLMTRLMIPVPIYRNDFSIFAAMCIVFQMALGVR